LLVVVGALAQPGLEFLVFLEEEFQGFGDNVSRRGINELSVLFESEFHVLFDTDLDGC
jgi:hypothetical protein